jgi:hypothetical protein
MPKKEAGRPAPLDEEVLEVACPEVEALPVVDPMVDPVVSPVLVVPEVAAALVVLCLPVLEALVVVPALLPLVAAVVELAAAVVALPVAALVPLRPTCPDTPQPAAARAPSSQRLRSPPSMGPV